jgi:hypothetical protein
MCNVTRQPRPFKVAPAVHGVCRWKLRPVRPTHDDINGGAGVLTINGTDYLFLFLADRVADGVVVRGYSLAKLDGQTDPYHIPADFSTCECMDAICRPRVDGCCKHQKAVKAALAVLDGDRPAPTPPHAPAAKPAYRSAGDFAANDPYGFDEHMEDAA